MSCYVHRVVYLGSQENKDLCFSLVQVVMLSLAERQAVEQSSLNVLLAVAWLRNKRN